MRHPITSALITLAVAAAATLSFAQTPPAPSAPPASPTPATPPATRPGATSTVDSDTKRELTDVPVRRVVLFSSGVGFFQHSGRITGNAATELRFKTDQINDILKSLVVSDTSANGGVKSITYGSQNPVARTLKSFQIDISSNPSLAGIINQIRGTKISLSLPDEKIDGVVLGVEEKERPVGPPGKPEDAKVVKLSYVNLITPTGIRSIQLEDVKKLEIQDEALQKELDQALAALAQARDKDKKPVIVNFDGQGERPVGIAYLLETPVWKTSYRLILPDPTSRDNATLLGWAIVENQTDNDWNNVTLDLVGGRPISFIQDLYQPLYVPRPRVQPKTYASLTPQTYEDGIDIANAERPPAQQAGARGGGGGAAGGRGGRGGAPAAAPANGPAGGFGGGGVLLGGAALSSSLARDQELSDLSQADFAQGVRSIADASKVGEMFQYSVKGVTLPRQRSSMIPIITDAVPFDRVSIYNQSVLARNALLGVRLKNQTNDYLLAGPLAILDRVKRPDGTLAENYAGDATVDDLPPGQERLMSYAVDQELLVDAKPRDSRSRLMTGSIIKGVLHLRYTDTATQTYILDNKGDREKQVVVEDPISVGFNLKSPTKPLEKTDKVYRFQLTSPPKKAVTFDVVEERVRGEEFALLPMDIGTLSFYSQTGEIQGGKLPDKVRAALQQATQKRQAVATLERNRQRREADRTRMLQEQANTRENIRVLPQGKSRDDAVADLTNKEADIKKANGDIAELQNSIDKARNDLDAYLNDLNVEG